MGDVKGVLSCEMRAGFANSKRKVRWVFLIFEII